MKQFFTLLIFASLLTACTRGIEKPSDPHMIIEKNIGDEFRLVLGTDPGTGYTWKIMDGMQGRVLELVEQYYQSTNEVTLVGGGAVEIWVFRAIGVGETTLTLGYFPPSNTPTDPEKTESFTVIVDE